VPYLLVAALSEARNGNLRLARQTFAKARELSQETDLSAPAIASLSAQLRRAGLEIDEDWRVPYAAWRDIHSSRPRHEDLGPLLWQTPTMENFQWVDSTGAVHDFEEESNGRPAVVVFLLNDCPRCDVQYELLEQKRAELDALGVNLIAVTSQEDNMPAYR